MAFYFMILISAIIFDLQNYIQFKKHFLLIILTLKARNFNIKAVLGPKGFILNFLLISHKTVN
jgi:hypothetical protein